MWRGGAGVPALAAGERVGRGGSTGSDHLMPGNCWSPGHSHRHRAILLEKASGVRGRAAGGAVRRAGGDEARLVGVNNRLNAVAEAELLQDAGDMRLGGRLADHEPVADLRIGQATGQQAEHFALAGREVGKGGRRPSLPGRRLPDELLDDRPGDRRGEQSLTPGDDAHGSSDLLWRGVLKHEAARACPQCLVDVGVKAERGKNQHLDSWLVARQNPRGLDPVEYWHANVHDHQVGPQPGSCGYCVSAVGRLADNCHPRLALQDLAEPHPGERLVVGEQDACHRAGSRTRTAKPPAGWSPTSRCPPYSVTRSRIPTSPCPLLAAPSAAWRVAPGPSSWISSSSMSAPYRMLTWARACPACFIVLVSASWTIRKADSSMPAGRLRGSPSMRSSTGRPASLTWAISVGSCARPGCGRSGSTASLRSIPSSLRISVRALRPTCSIVCRTSRVELLVPSSTRRSAPARSTIIETLCAITSCSSRATRARSATTASRAATSRSRSAIRARRSRSPTMRRTSSITATVTTVNGTTTCTLAPCAAGGARNAAATSTVPSAKRRGSVQAVRAYRAQNVAIG